MLPLLLLACFHTPADCLEGSCQSEAIFDIVGRAGPVISHGSYAPEDGAFTDFDCAVGSGAGWTCDADGRLHVATDASRMTITAYGADATYGYFEVALSWGTAGTAECPSECEVANATLALDPYETGCFWANDTGGCG